jgi:DNA-directed RNA polymerase specialized sigma24 family protein
MAVNRCKEYWLPAAWRGVASPGYLRMCRWHALVEELGGLRAFGSREPVALDDSLTGSIHKAGLMDMGLLTEAAEVEQLDELQQFVLKRLNRHERLVLMLHYAEGLSLGEIAEVLDLPDATVAGIFNATMGTLRAHFS